MRKFIVLICLFCFMIAGCGSDKTLNGIEYETYGLINRDEIRNDEVQYKVITGNIVWSVLLFGTVIFPIYFIGFSLYEPVSLKHNRTSYKGIL